MSAEADGPGAIAVPDRRLDSPGVQAALDREVGNGLVDDPGDPVRHLEDIHQDDGPHAGVPRVCGRLDRVQLSRTAGQVWRDQMNRTPITDRRSSTQALDHLHLRTTN